MQNLGQASVTGVVFVVGVALVACESKERQPPVSQEMQQLRDRAGLHPEEGDPRDDPANAGAAGGSMTAQTPELREKAGLHPTEGEDYAETPQELRRELRLRPEEKPPPSSAAEMRDRAGLHPEPSESQR